MKKKFVIILLAGLFCVAGLAGCSSYKHHSRHHHGHHYSGGRHHGGKHSGKHSGKHHKQNKNRRGCDCPKGF